MKYIFIALTFLCVAQMDAKAQVAKKPRPETQVELCKNVSRPSQQANCLLDAKVSGFFESLLDGNVVPLSESKLTVRELKQMMQRLERQANPKYQRDRSEYGLVGRYFILHSVLTGVDNTIDSAHQINAYTLSTAKSTLQLNGPFQFYIDTEGEKLFNRSAASNEVTISFSEALEKKLGLRSGRTGFIHVGLLSASSENTSVSKEQAKGLAYIYVSVSASSGRWLIPAFHNSLEANSHNPQISSDLLPLWEEQIKEVLAEIVGTYNDKFKEAKVPEQEAEPESQDSSQQAKLETALEKSLTISEISFKASIGKLVPIKDGATIKGYKADEVVKVFLQNKRELLESLSSDEFAALRAYIEKFYPRPPNPVSLKSGFKFGIHRFSSARVEQLVNVNDFNASAKQVYAFYAKLNQNKQAIDLEVRSDPNGATVVLTAGSGKVGGSADTNSTMTNIFRGIYTYVVTKEGFRTIKRTLNLVDERGTKLECSLSKTESGSCTFK